MKNALRSIALAEVALILPAVLFLTAVVARSIQPTQYEPAHTAQAIVDWYAARPGLGLWILLIALPLMVLAMGAVTLMRRWKDDGDLRKAAQAAFAALRGQFAMVVVSVATVA